MINFLVRKTSQKVIIHMH